jgi:hypothetical protein
MLQSSDAKTLHRCYGNKMVSVLLALGWVPAAVTLATLFNFFVKNNPRNA